LIFSLFNWRCPSCNKYLGKAINAKFCAKCGVQLD
jgi:rRNA maturation endonuclease Nob1